MDRETRNRIQRATQAARELLEHEYAEQLEGVFDIGLDGSIAADPGEHLDAPQRVLRRKLVTAVEHQRTSRMSKADAVASYVREAAFTTLNRFVALKMLEPRELVQECISRGDQSAGFKEFTGLAPGLVQLPDHGYRVYVESLFDEIGREVRVLFDRRDPASLLWPRRQGLLDLLGILNAAELEPVWGEDETIGWFYQYFNSDDERKKMRAESQAPRNSRELAVRNQFFTPRYVVQFLTDNTLGRIWYEMRRGDTRLRGLDYLVRRPNEIFLGKGEVPPAETDASDADLTQDELLLRPVHVPFRPKKDPRDVRVLDPACGSGHFLLYAFDLLLVIYEEAWNDVDSPVSEVTGNQLRDDYPDIGSLRKATPGLVLRYNLHGIDIDARCTQIAALALWMRAHRCFSEVSLRRSDRAPVRRTNIVVAEPLPGGREIRDEFTSSLGSDLGKLIDRVFDRLALAGDAGSLLKAESEIDSAIRDIYGESGPLFRNADQDRWSIAEADLLKALREYAEVSQDGAHYRRCLFSEDAARGLGFVDLCRQRFDVVLMNPPFGETARHAKQYVRERYPISQNDIFAAFVERGVEFLQDGGRLGAITSRTGFFITSLRDWRQRALFEWASLEVIADLGEGVMDSAVVEAAAYCLSRGRQADQPVAFRLLTSEEHSSDLRNATSDLANGERHAMTYAPRMQELARLPESPLAYWLDRTAVSTFVKWPQYEPAAGDVRKGLRTGDNFRFVRALWELPPGSLCTDALPGSTESADGWVPLVMTGAIQPWFSPMLVALNWQAGAAELRAYVTKYGSPSRLIQSEDFYFRPGFSWTRRARRFVPYFVPRGCIFTGSRPMSFPHEGLERVVVGVFASRVASAFLRLYGEKFAWPNFLEGKLKLLPWPSMESDVSEAIETFVERQYGTWRSLYRFHEPFHEFVAPHLDIDAAPTSGGGLAFDLGSLLTPELESRIRYAYGFDASSAARAERDLSEALALRQSSAGEDADEDGEDDSESVVVDTPETRAAGLASYAIGCAFGRWDIRLALPESCPSVAVSPSDPLSRTPAGMLRNQEADTPTGYPIRVLWNGIAVADRGHEDDLEALVDRVFAVIFGERAENMLAMVLRNLPGAADRGLGPWLHGSFFQYHIGLYSRSRRKAPIYWQLATPSGRYSIWLYYQQLSNDSFYKILNDYAVPKLEHEERRLANLALGAANDRAAAQRREVEEQGALVEELRTFREELGRVAPIWNPNFNDGVIINFASLWRLVPQNRPWQKECKKVWDKLCKGDYDWAHLAMHLWPERVVPKCAEDRSLAIAHALEDVFWYEDSDGKWQPRKVAKSEVAKLVKERTSAAVKDALKSLLEAPAPATGRATRKKAPRAKGNRKRAASTRPKAATNGASSSGRSSTAVDDDLLTKVKAAIGPNGDGASKADVIDATGISASQWNKAIKALLADGSVTQTGERRGARYHLGGGAA